MSHPTSEIDPFEIRGLINKLISFLGPLEVEKGIRKYEDSLKFSGPVFQEFIKMRHPWWSPFKQFMSLEKQGKSIRKHLTPELKLLTGDARMIDVLEKKMPASVRKKYARDLLIDERVFDYLLEIHTAWHFFLKGFEIKWFENDSSQHGEFLVRAPDFEFDVECKRISEDAAKSIHRKDFYRLADKLNSKMGKLGYHGKIEIFLRDKLYGNEKSLNDLTEKIGIIVISGKLKGIYEFSYGSVSLDLENNTEETVNLEAMRKNLWERKEPQAYASIFATSKCGRPIDPIEIIIQSLTPNEVPSAIRDRIEEACKDQLKKSKPGVICCYLEGISDSDLQQLSKGSHLQRISSELLCKEEFSHIAAITYRSENVVQQDVNTENYYSQGLFFNNPYCKFEKARNFVFGGTSPTIHIH